MSTQHSLTSLCAKHRIAHDQGATYIKPVFCATRSLVITVIGPLIARSQILPFFLQGYQEEQVFFQNPTVFHVFWNLLCVPLTQRPPFRRHTPQPPTVVPNPSDPRRPSSHVPQPAGTTAPSLSNQVEPVSRPSAPAPGAHPHRQTSSSSPQPASGASGSAPASIGLIKEEKDRASLPSVTDTTTPSKSRMPKVKENSNDNAQEQVDMHKRATGSDSGAHPRAEGYVLVRKITCLTCVDTFVAGSIPRSRRTLCDPLTINSHRIQISPNSAIPICCDYGNGSADCWLAHEKRCHLILC